ncbi:hypothetical protein [Methylocystis parvus]|uniref:hypothetical protein n=1 Tax=Methylocystis parvus TaxID=134 RepID=UPI003C73D4FB
MSVKTQTPRLAAIRRGVMELYISDHPLDCLTCAPMATASCRTWPARSVCAKSVMAMTARTTSSRATMAKRISTGSRRTSRTPISPTIRRSASSATAACAPARRCRAPSR